MSKPITKLLLDATLVYLKSIAKDKEVGQEMKELTKPTLGFWATVWRKDDGALRATKLYNSLLKKFNDDDITDIDVLNYVMKLVDPENIKELPDGLGTSTDLRFYLLNVLCRYYRIAYKQIESIVFNKVDGAGPFDEKWRPHWVRAQFGLVKEQHSAPQELDMMKSGKEKEITRPLSVSPHLAYQ